MTYDTSKNNVLFARRILSLGFLSVIVESVRWVFSTNKVRSRRRERKEARRERGREPVTGEQRQTRTISGESTCERRATPEPQRSRERKRERTYERRATPEPERSPARENLWTESDAWTTAISREREREREPEASAEQGIEERKREIKKSVAAIGEKWGKGETSERVAKFYKIHLWTSKNWN